ncbi:hypothetical protein [Marinigracilibium pacificum]|uniref:Uncharacterized protein n=1 Tax=Marinigracilibium pacificum TaxID=2729599 RepID=A0A848J963_9BACT|nr:hypothetical protein [Marinigracilibium pacificum]NMM50919.1 hypothetical protein [Marinigracilibium pacificum]
MNRVLLILATILFVSCQTETELFDDVNEMAEFDRDYKLTLIQSGKESGFLEPIMEYSLYMVDSIDFRNLENSVLTNDMFKEGTFYLNIELNDYIYENDLDIINMSRSLITKNKYDKVYYLYLLSDGKTIAVCKINS